MDSEEYKEWYEGHKEECDKGSTNAMEIAGVKTIWLRSVKDLKLGYISLLVMEMLRPCLCDWTIWWGCRDNETQVCWKEWGRRFGSWSSPVLRMKTANLWSLKAGSDNATTTLNVYYGSAIRNNKDDIDGVGQAIDASFLHCLSTDEHPMNIKCSEHHPPDKISWCRLKVAVYEKSTPEPHNPLIPSDLAKYGRPVYMRLANRELLERCTLGATQN